MNREIENQMKIAVDKIYNSKNIYIVSHVNPDGDSLGSSLALALGLKKINKEVHVLKVDETPVDFIFLPESNLIRNYNKNDDIDLLIAVDSSDIDRLGKNKNLVSIARNIINIDHHISNTKFGDINIVDSNASATGELIYDFLNLLDIDISENIATCIYTALSTDTGNFMYDNTSAKTHRIVAKLIEYGSDKESINMNIYQSRSLERTNLFIKALSNMEMTLDNKVATIKITQALLQSTNTVMEDTEGIISFVRDIEPVEVAVLLKEVSDTEVKVSMRSKRNVDVSQITSIFGGGGHRKAAGCTINKSIHKANKLIVEELKKVL